MNDPIPLRYRRLPDGEFLEGRQVNWNGSLLEFEPEGPVGALSAGDLLEIESPSAVYLGQLEQWRGAKAAVLVEHSIDRSKLPGLDKAWS